ncbi:MAG: BREX system P-loop protein BrxC [Saprospiraceae bacterium]
MKISELFLKDVKRPIETVIKADDEENVLIEVEEYVITKEIAKKIVNFFAEYNEYKGVNGVWISGFFGSGKSHLLKILSHVLENKEFDGARLGNVFAEKLMDDELLKADVTKAIRIPTESILFNIDQQAQITSKADVDAILNVFYKVFNDHLGYFGAQRHVADFERWLDEDGVYTSFMELYEQNAGEHWTVGRRKYFAPNTKTAIAKTLGQIHQDDADKYKDILESIRKDHKISVDDFCEKVAQYISKKDHGFRLNFFIDEVGQFISDNTKLMLNLQTIAETLATKCKGRAWIFATAQEDLEAIVGDQSAVNSDDFSKIQGRFKCRIPLTSANVDEVIEKRLLAKRDDAKKILGQNWVNEQANLQTILSFSEAGVQFRKFQDEKDYVNKYPFIPYQFDLFQQCIKELSKHNAFQGKHASVGERSMLGVFQEVLRDLADDDSNTLVSFDQMFEGIRSTIRGEIQNAITLAENNITNELAKRVLKALFLIKYYTNFRTNVRNISVLMLTSTKVDLKMHETGIKEALNLLENQTYIQRNGEVYEFLTDDEKDVENEIKGTHIDGQQITQFFNEIIFDNIIGDNRIRYADNKQEYEFTKKIDGAMVGNEKELIIEFLTPNSDHYGKDDYYKAYTMGYNSMALFVLPQSDRLLQDIRLYLKTEKYYKQNISSTNKHSLQLIIIDKQSQNIERKRQLTNTIKGLLGECTVYMNGSKLHTGSTSDAKTKVIQAFQDLIKLAYPSLKIIGQTTYTEEMLKNTMRARMDDLFGSDDSTMSEAEADIYNMIVRRKKQNDVTSISDIKAHFSKKPYGWYMPAILNVTARLYKRGKIEARHDSNVLSDEDFLSNLMNNRTYGNTMLEPLIEVDQDAVKKLKVLYQGLFDENCPFNEVRDVAKIFKEKAKAETRELNKLIGNQGQYPFLVALEPLTELLEKLSLMDNSALFNNVKTHSDELLDLKEDVLDPIRRFWNGEQKQIFDRVIQFLNGDQSNFEYIDKDEIDVLKAVQKDPKPYAGNQIKMAKDAIEKLVEKVTQQINAEKEITLAKVYGAVDQIKLRKGFDELDEQKQLKVLQPFEELVTKVKEQRYISTIRQYEHKVEQIAADQLTEYERLLRPDQPEIQYITLQNVKILFGKSELINNADIDEYLEKLKEEMVRHIEQNRRIKL